MDRWSIEIDSVAAGLVVLAVMLGLGQTIATRGNFYRRLLAAQENGRYGAIDGLRGILAPAVFLGHIVGNYYWYHLQYRGWPPSVFYTLCGSASVSLFFMITGYLFWRRAAAAPGRMNVRALLRSRWRRLAPLYFSALAVIFAVAGIQTHWTLVVPPLELVSTVAQWGSFGVFGLSAINGLPETFLIDPPLWSLRYEWLFYLALPGLSFLATPYRLAGLVLVWAGLSTSGLFVPLDYIIANFLTGMIVAQVAVARPLPSVLHSRAAAALALLPLLGIGLTTDGDFSVLQSLALAPLFTVVAAGNNLFGILSSRAARCLGVMSYSTYVLHCPVLYLVLGLINRFIAVGALAPATFWALNLPIAAIVVAVSALSYRWIEHPFLATPSTVERAPGMTPAGLSTPRL